VAHVQLCQNVEFAPNADGAFTGCQARLLLLLAFTGSQEFFEKKCFQEIFITFGWLRVAHGGSARPTVHVSYLGEVLGCEESTHSEYSTVSACAGVILHRLGTVQFVLN